MPVRAALLVIVAALVVLSAGSAAAGARKSLRVGLIVDAAALNDRTAGQSVYLGLRRAVKQLGIRGRVLTPSPKEGFAPSVDYLVRQGYDVVIVASYDPELIARFARTFPQTTFVVPDEVVPGRLPNVRSLIFREEEVGYLVGYLAALMEEQRPGKDVVGSIGGGRFASVDRYIAGFRAGARAADPGIVLLNDYTNDFVDPRSCRGAAVEQIARGAGAIFPVAAACGFGALEAARTDHVWGIGVDTDQSYLGPHILTSAMKREDVALLDTLRALEGGSLRGGGTSVFTLRNGGLQLGRVSPGVPARTLDAVERIRRRIVAGGIRIPQTVS